MTAHTDDQFVRSLTRALDIAMQDDDQELLNKFAAMRTEALRHVPQEGARNARRFFAPAFSAAAAILLVALVIILPGREAPGEVVAAVDEFDMLVESEDLEMFAQGDIEFYLWLESELASRS